MEIWTKPQMQEVQFTANEFVSACYTRNRQWNYGQIVDSKWMDIMLTNMENKGIALNIGGTVLTATDIRTSNANAGLKDEFDGYELYLGASSGMGPTSTREVLDTDYNSGCYYGNIVNTGSMEGDSRFLQSLFDAGENSEGSVYTMEGLWAYKTAKGAYLFSTVDGWVDDSTYSMSLSS